MDKEQFNINVYSNDAKFCSSLAVECNKYGFELTFFEEHDVGNKKLLESALISVVIIDLTEIKKIDPYMLGEKMRISSDLPVFGVLDRFNRENQNRAKKCGFDLVFTKSMLLKSIKEVVIHISNEEE